MHRMFSVVLSILLITLVASCGEAQRVFAPKPLLVDGIRVASSGAEIAAHCDIALEDAKAEFASLEAQTSDATVETVFGQYENVVGALTSVGDVWYLRSVYPDADVRDAATQCSEKQSRNRTNLTNPKSWEEKRDMSSWF